MILSTVACVDGATSWIETTKKSLVALAAATTGRNCVATADVIFPNFRPRYPCEQAQITNSVIPNEVRNLPIEGPVTLITLCDARICGRSFASLRMTARRDCRLRCSHF